MSRAAGPVPDPFDPEILAHLAAADSPADGCQGLLFHGSLETWDGGPLRVGGYDGVFWTAEGMPMVAQCYIPVSGGSVLFSVSAWEMDEPVRPVRHSVTADIARRVMGAPDPEPEYDARGDLVSFRVAPGWPTNRQVCDFVVGKLGYEPAPDGIFEIRTRMVNGMDEYLPAGQTETGSLFILRTTDELRIFDMAAGREGDLSAPDFHRLDEFRALAKDGWDAVRINDFCQSEVNGNVGHRSLGLFPSGLAKVRATMVPAVHREGGVDGLWHEATPEVINLWEEARMYAALRP